MRTKYRGVAWDGLVGRWSVISFSNTSQECNNPNPNPNPSPSPNPNPIALTLTPNPSPNPKPNPNPEPNHTTPQNQTHVHIHTERKEYVLAREHITCIHELQYDPNLALGTVDVCPHILHDTCMTTCSAGRKAGRGMRCYSRCLLLGASERSRLG
jgi:hypothetical protein